jgi:hypothetical protein
MSAAVSLREIRRRTSRGADAFEINLPSCWFCCLLQPLKLHDVWKAKFGLC